MRWPIGDFAILDASIGMLTVYTRLLGEFVPKMSLFNSRKIQWDMDQNKFNFPQAGSYIALNALNEKLNLF